MTNEENLSKSTFELLKKTTSELPSDVTKVIKETKARENDGSTAQYAMDIIQKNLDLASRNQRPICQDTGTVLIYVDHPVGFSQKKFTQIAEKEIVKATQAGFLRQNSVDPITGQNKGMNIGPGHPAIHFHEHDKDTVTIKMMLKGGGCENVGAQYALPYTTLNAGRDLSGVRKVILEAVLKAQGKGCSPGVLGVCIGGDRGSSFMESKNQFLRRLDDVNGHKELRDLEEDILESANKLGVGPMGFSGNTTLLGCKIGMLNRLPASYYVSISYMCWAYRRQGVELAKDNTISKWIY